MDGSYHTAQTSCFDSGLLGELEGEAVGHAGDVVADGALEAVLVDEVLEVAWHQVGLGAEPAEEFGQPLGGLLGVADDGFVMIELLQQEGLQDLQLAIALGRQTDQVLGPGAARRWASRCEPWRWRRGSCRCNR